MTSEVIYSQQLYAVAIGDVVFLFTAGTTREQAMNWIAEAQRIADEEMN